MDTAVLCIIVKNEHLYLDEWIRYHLALGFDHIYIYDNDEKHPHKRFSYQGRVTFFRFYGSCRQIECYNQFIEKYKTKHKWVGFLDADEFIVLRHHKKIKPFLRQYCKNGALVLNWVLFGSAGKQIYQPRPVLERFQFRQNSINRHIKTIGCIKQMVRMADPHHVILRNNVPHDCNGCAVNGPWHDTGRESIACIHHYFTKSKEEFIKKCARGNADHPEYRDVETDFKRHDFNERHDSSALNFYRAFIK